MILYEEQKGKDFCMRISYNRHMILVSACLAGIKCSWDGKDRLNKEVKALVDEGKAIPVCPEVLGGFSVPRERTEILNANGEDVLDRKAKVITETGEDVSVGFIKGAKAVLKIAKENNVQEAILKSKSPSCGCGRIYDGSFSGRLIKGNGVTTALLQRYGINCRNSNYVEIPIID